MTKQSSSKQQKEKEKQKENNVELVLEVFKEYVGDKNGGSDGTSTSFTPAYIQLDKIMNRARDVETFVNAYLHPLKLFLCYTSTTSDTKAIVTCKFISKYIVHLYTSSIINSNNTTQQQDKETQLKVKKKQVKDKLLGFIYDASDSKETIVRLRSLQIINMILSENDLKVEILNIGTNKRNESHDIKLMIDTRCKDKVTMIRSLAVAIAMRYSTLNKDAWLLEEIVSMMQSDSIWNIRDAILKQIVPLAVAVRYKNTSEMIGHVIQRAKDVKQEIRSTAYHILSKWYKVDDFSSDDIAAIIEHGLDDPIQRVKDACQELLISWLSKIKADNPDHYIYIFLETMEVCTDIQKALLVERALLSVYERAGLDDFSLRTDYKDLTPEQAFLFKLTVRHLSTNSKYEDRLDSLLPTLTEYRNILIAHLNETYVIVQLLEALQQLDMGDEVGRSNLETFLVEILKVLECDGVVSVVSNSIKPDKPTINNANIDLDKPEVIKQTLACLSLVIGVERTFIVRMVEMLSDFRDPIETDPNIAELEDVEDQLKKLKSTKKKQQQQQHSNEIKQLEEQATLLRDSIFQKNTIALRKCSVITHYLLLNAKKCSNSPEIDGLLQLVILPSIQHSLPDLRKIGIQNLGIFCLHRRTAALSYLNLFEKILENDNQDIQLVCLKVIFDIILVFGSPKTIPKETVPLYKMIRRYSQLSIDVETKMICVEGFVKLLYSGIIQDQKILIFLFMELMSPGTKDLLELRKCLYLFFQCFVTDSLENKILLFNSTMSIMKSVTQSVRGSNYASVNLIELTKFLLFLFDKPCKSSSGNAGATSPTKKIGDLVVQSSQATFSQCEQFDVDDIHPLIGIQICQELISCFRGDTRELTKVLHLLRFDKFKHQTHLIKIYQLLDKLSILYTDTHLNKFQETIAELIKSATNIDPELMDLSQLNNNSIPTSATNTTTTTTPTKLQLMFESKTPTKNNNSNGNSKSTTPNKKPITPNKKKVDQLTGSSEHDSMSLFANVKSNQDSQSDAIAPTPDKRGRVKIDLGTKSKDKDFNISSLKSFFSKQKKLLDTVEFMDKSKKQPKKKLKVDNNNSIVEKEKEINQKLSQLNVNNNKEKVKEMVVEQQQEEEEEFEESSYDNWTALQTQRPMEFNGSIDKPTKKTTRSILKKRENDEMDLDIDGNQMITSITNPKQQKLKRVRFNVTIDKPLKV